MSFGDTIIETVLGGSKPTVPEDTNNAPNAVAEGAAVNTTVGITAHSTFANGNASLDYSLSADSSGGGFKIDQNTGVVTVADPSKIDFESSPGHLYTITVLATKNNNFSSQQTFTISVNDVAPSTPVDSNAAANTVLEGAANGTAVGVTASSTDVNGPAVTWSLIGDTSGGGFTINAATGVITVADGTKINYESSPGHAYTVIAQASDGTLTSSQAFTINVGDVAPTTPVDIDAAANTVAEGAAVGTTVGITASAVDPNGPASTYSLIGDTSGGGFTINASTGVVSVANSGKIDFESSGPGHSYNITVQATTGALATSQTFTIGVTDAAPSTLTDSDAATNTVVEGAANGSTVGVTASSTDVNGPAVTYVLIGDTSLGGFAVNSATGVVTVLDGTKINYETAVGHAYNVTVQASDGTLTSSQTFSIAVTDVAPSTPVDANAAINTVAEGAASGTAVGITASSTDINGPAVTYSLTGDTSGGGFTINSATGVITVGDATKIDYETAAGHAYTVTAQASDGTLASSQTFTIAVTDVAPSALNDSDAATNSVAEGAANGSTVGVTASSVDPNGPAASYSLTDNAGGRFAINSTTGVVTVANGAAIDFETAAGHAYTITVQALVGAITNSQTFSIGVTDVAPSAPADANPAADTVFEGAANGTAVGITASSSDPGGGPTATFSLTDSAGGRFAINSTTGIVTVANGAAIDFETATGHAYNITVQALAGALSSTRTFSIGVGNVNEAPAGTDKTVTTAEDTHYVFSVADFGFTDPADSSTPNALQAVKITTVPAGGTLTNNGGAVSAGNFIPVADIVAGHLVFTPTADANGSPEASFTFQVQDNGGTANGGINIDPSPNTITINVTPVNDAPSFTSGANQTVLEDAGPQTVAGFATAISPGPANESGQTVDFVVAGDTNPGLFAVGPAIAADGTLTYTPAANANGSATITVHAHDNGPFAPPSVNVSSDQSFTITVNAVNDAPSFTLAPSDTVNEDSGARSVAGFASAIAAGPADESGQTVSFIVTNNTNAALFAAGGGPAIAADGTLTYTPAANASGTATITVHAHDSGGTANGGVDNSGDQTFVINVNAVNDAPTATGLTQSLTINEDDPATTLFTTAPVVSDIDSANVTATLTLDATQGVLNNAGAGVLAGGVLTYTISGTKAAVNAALAGVTYHSAPDFNGSASVGVTIDDGFNGPQGTNPTGTVSITVNPINDAPVVTAGHTLNYTENQAATAIDPALIASDIDSPNLASATVQITGNYINGEDVLAFVNTATITGSFNAATGTLTLTGSDTVANYQAALRAVTYFNTSDTPSGAARTVTIITNDGFLNSTPATDTINVSAVNDAPVVTAGHTLNYTENQAATAIDTALTVSDVDSANLASATVQITGNYVNGEDVLAFVNTATITGSFDALTGTLTLTGADTVANYQAALRTVTYVNTSDNPSGAARTVTIIANDGAASSVAATDTINVTPVNDAPVVTAGHTLNYTENQAATAIDTALVVSDVDSANLASATVQITGNYVNGEDLLAFANTATITATFDALTGTLTLTGSDTVANYQAALRAVTYFNTSDNPSGAARTVTIITNDGALNSVAATDTINVTPVNDAPVVTAGHTLGYTENQAAPAIDPAITVSDADSANLASATVQITGNYVNGQDVLAFVNTATITGSFNAATGTLTLTGSDTVANYQAALRAVTYANTSDDPSAAARTVTIITNDGALNSVATTDTITVTAVNDAPTLTATGNNPNYSAGVDLFSAVSASTIEAGQLLDQLKLTVTNISGTATDSLTIDGVSVALTNGNVVSTTTPGVTATVAVSGSTATVTIASTPGLSGSAMATLVDGISYTDTNVNPGDPARVVTLTLLHDTGGTSPGSDTTVLNITSTVVFDQAPVVTAGHTLNYTENQAATAFDTAITVTDADNANLASATVQITGNYVSGEDVLAFVNTATITGSFNAGTGTLTLTGSDTVANYQAALRAVTYVNTSDNPSGAARTVTITANDGFVNSTPVTDTINVTPVNDAPVVTAGHTLNYTENQVATAFDPAITVSDVDSANLASATVQITGNYANGQDVLAFVNTATITGSFNAGTGTLTLTGSDTVANYQAALASVTYVNTSENPSGLARTVTIITNDGALNSVAKTDTINVTPVNDAPVTTAGGTLNYTENQVATVIDASVTATDVDNANLASATVAITVGFATGQDVLDANVTGTSIGKSYNASTGVLTLTGSDTKAHYQQVLDSVTYFNSSDNPSGAARTVSYTVNDGALNSNTSTATVNVTPVNDAPVVTATGTLAYTENQAATAIAPALTVTDADTTTLTTATVTISANYVNGEDVLAFSTQNGITGSFNAGTGTMTLTGTASVANYQTAMESVTYVNTSENPSTAARTVTFKADDGQAANHLSAGSDHTITVASVDDAPINNGVPGPFTVMSGFTHAITGLSITDVDAGSGNDITTTLTSVGTAFVTVGAVGGGAAITGNGTNAVTLTGTIGQINASLGGSVVYTAADNITTSQQTTLTIATNDHGHTGTGGPITDTDVVTVGVTPQVWFIDQAQTGLVGTEPRGSQLNPFSDVNEFNAASLTSTGPGANDYIYVKQGTYNGQGINLKAGQTLLGDDQALSLADPFGGPAIVIETSSGARPTINVTAANSTDQGIALASGNTVQGIIVTTNASGQTAIDDSGATVGTLTIGDTDVSGGGQAVNITHGGALTVALGTVSSSGGAVGIGLGGALTGTFTGTTGTLSGHTTSEVSINGGSGTVSYGGIINDGTGLSASIANRTAGTVTLSGTINDGVDAGGGITLSGNSGGTIDFTGATKTLNTTTGNGVSITTNGATVDFTNGGLNIDTTTGNGFSASGGGTVNVTTGASINSIATGTGTALNINGTTIGASNVTFHDIGANGAVNGIVLNNTGTSGHLAVTGSGSVAQGGDSTGGTIQSTTGAGISLTTTLSPTLNNMNIQSTSGSGINGTDVTNFTFTNGTINNSGTGHGVDTSNIAFNTTPAGATNNVDGTVTITNNILSNAYYHGVDIQNRTGTIDNLTISNNAITSATAQVNSQGSGIHVITFGTGSTAANLTKATIDSNAIANFPTGAGIAIEGGNSNAAGPGGTMGVPNNATNIIAITNNNIHGLSTATPIGSEGIVALVQGGNAGSRSQGNFNISGNTITDTLGQGVVVSDFGDATVNAKVNTNIVDTNNIGKAIGSNGIGIGTGVVGVDNAATPLMTVEVIGNTVTDYDGNGIRLVALDTNGTLNATVQNNIVGRAAGGGFPSRIRIDSGNENSAGNNTVNLDITGNTTTGASVATDAPGIGLRLGDGGAATNIMRIEGLSPSPATDVQTENFVSGNNPGMFAGTLAGSYSPAKKTEVIHGTTFFATAGNVPQPQLALHGPGPGSSEVLTMDELTPVLAIAIQHWADAGASAAQISQLEHAAASIQISDIFASSAVAQTDVNGQITIDANAAGWGWFVDSTPADNNEFHATATANELTASSGDAAGHMDLLTAVEHELGHVIGLDDSNAAGVMNVNLDVGERRLVDPSDVAHANASSAEAAEAALPVSAQAAAGTPIVVGTTGNDTIDAGHGGNILFGGAGADHFVFGPSIQLNAPTPAQVTHIADYSAAQGDTFDFSALTSAFHNSSVNDSLVVRAVEDASGKFATLQVDHIDPMGMPSAPNWVSVAQIDGAHAGDAVNILIDNHSVHLAQIHVDLLV